jgi:hypothetical protein
MSRYKRVILKINKKVDINDYEPAYITEDQCLLVRILPGKIGKKEQERKRDHQIGGSRKVKPQPGDQCVGDIFQARAGNSPVFIEKNNMIQKK